MKHIKKKIVFLCFVLLLCLISPYRTTQAAASMSPVISSVSWTRSGVILSWSKSTKSSGYIVYRKNGNAKYKKLATVKTGSYKDSFVKSGMRYTYLVRNVYQKKYYDSKAVSFDVGSFKSANAISLKMIYTGKTQKAVLQWKAVSGSTYAVMEKTGSSAYKKIASVKAKSSSQSYTVTKLSAKKRYKFTLKKISSSRKKVSSAVKIKGKPIVAVKDVNNSNATISWSKLTGVDGYYIYRKVAGHAYRKIATVNSSVLKYKDEFYRTINSEDKKYINIKNYSFLYREKYFLDPSMNPLVYTVRGYKKTSKGVVESSYMKEGAAKLSTPVIINVTKSATSATISWGVVPAADGYYIYIKVSGSWKRVAAMTQKSNALNGYLKKKIACGKSTKDFAVRAYRKQNGKIVLGASFGRFTTDNHKYTDKKIMFIGDSITYGTIYRGGNKDIFSYPYKLGKLTGAEIYNTAIPGATLSYQSGSKGECLIDSVIDPISAGSNMKVTHQDVSYAQRNNSNGYTFKDFDVIVMCVGTNDYDDYGTGHKIGIYGSKDKSEFYGALTITFDKILEASEKRVKEGKKAIKVIYLDLFYRDCYASCLYNYKGSNTLGYTLRDYQNAIDDVCRRYNNSEYLSVYQMSTSAYVSGKNMNVYYSTSDNLHPTRITYSQIAEGLVKFMLTKNILK